MTCRGVALCNIQNCKAWRVVVDGQPYSKANRRIPARSKTGKPIWIKSKEALKLEKHWQAQCPVVDPLIEVELEAYIKLYYSSRLPDLDESLVLDLLQGKLIKNDRQIRRKVVGWGLDKLRPRSIVLLRPLAARPCCSDNRCLLQETLDQEGGL